MSTVPVRTRAHGPVHSDATAPFFLASGSLFDVQTLSGLLIGTALCATGASTWNQLIEHKCAQNRCPLCPKAAPAGSAVPLHCWATTGSTDSIRVRCDAHRHDSRMVRTQNRPLVQGRISLGAAAAFGAASSAGALCAGRAHRSYGHLYRFDLTHAIE